MTAVIVLAAVCGVCWAVHSYRVEGQRLNTVIEDFNRTHPIREPGRDEL